MSGGPLFFSMLPGGLRGYADSTEEASESEFRVSVLVYWPEDGDVMGWCWVYVHSGSC